MCPRTHFVFPSLKLHNQVRPQYVEVDLNKKSYSGSKTTTAWKVIPCRLKINHNWNPRKSGMYCEFSKNDILLMQQLKVVFRPGHNFLFKSDSTYCGLAKCYFNIDFASNNRKKYAQFNRIWTAGSSEIFLPPKANLHLHLSFSFSRNSFHSEWNKTMNNWISEYFIEKITQI